MRTFHDQKRLYDVNGGAILILMQHKYDIDIPAFKTLASENCAPRYYLLNNGVPLSSFRDEVDFPVINSETHLFCRIISLFGESLKVSEKDTYLINIKGGCFQVDILKRKFNMFKTRDKGQLYFLDDGREMKHPDDFLVEKQQTKVKEIVFV
jgi:hypothetical protein